MLNNNYTSSLKNLWARGLLVIWVRPLRKQKGCTPLPPSPRSRRSQEFRGDHRWLQVITGDNKLRKGEVRWLQGTAGGNWLVRFWLYTRVTSNSDWLIKAGDAKWIQVMPAGYQVVKMDIEQPLPQQARGSSDKSRLPSQAPSHWTIFHFHHL